MTPQEINKKFAELAAIHVHEWNSKDSPESLSRKGDGRTCKTCGMDITDPKRVNCPDFCADPRLVLEVMMKREDWPEFRDSTSIFWCGFADYVRIDYMTDTTGKFVLAAIEFLEKK